MPLGLPLQVWLGVAAALALIVSDHVWLGVSLGRPDGVAAWDVVRDLDCVGERVDENDIDATWEGVWVGVSVVEPETDRVAPADPLPLSEGVGLGVLAPLAVRVPDTLPVDVRLGVGA